MLSESIDEIAFNVTGLTGGHSITASDLVITQTSGPTFTPGIIASASLGGAGFTVGMQWNPGLLAGTQTVTFDITDNNHDLTEGALNSGLPRVAAEVVGIPGGTHTGVIDDNVSISPALTMTNSGSATPGPWVVGQLVTDTITVTNTGNTQLTNLTVTDPLDLTNSGTVGTLRTLGLGASQNFTFTYTATATEVGNNGINTAALKLDQLINGVEGTVTAVGSVGAPVSISGDVFLDQNADGVLDGGDTTLPGVTVQLLDNAGHPIAGETAITNGSGAYSFANLTPGTYSVAVTAPAGDSFSPVGTNPNPALDSIVNAGGTTTPVTLSPGGSATNQNAGAFAPATFTTTVYTDVNGDGSLDNGETGLPGVTVDLENASNTILQTATTDASGNVSFSGLVPGSYQVVVLGPSGDAVTQHSNVATVNTLGSGGTANAIEGVYVPATFTTRVYTDANDDGSQDNGETGLPGVTVNLLDGSGNPTGQSATTDANGNASFTGLIPGTYEVSVVTPGGDVVTQATNLNTPNTLVSGGTASATEGVFAPAPGLSIVKSVLSVGGAPGDGPITYAGEVIDYQIVVHNTGNETLTNVTVTDPLTGVASDIGPLNVGATDTIDTSYQVTQTDIDSDGNAAGTQIYVSNMALTNGYEFVTFTG